jgi:hypothetical protein
MTCGLWWTKKKDLTSIIIIYSGEVKKITAFAISSTFAIL